ncbi:MAG: nucleotidyltransferase domain-containing protein [Thermodesulfovibrio sp.]|nr:nucleotidyltransferase domain-containing protein [Thermodesulfovibrio sp.]
MIENIIKNTIENIFSSAGIRVIKILLFGSRAKGETKKDSDWDLLIVVEKKLTRQERTELGHLIRKELANHLIPCDVLIRSLEEIEERKHVIGSVIKTAINEGVPL